MSKPHTTILFLLLYPLRTAPSQRFRVEAYLDLLNRNGFSYDISTFFDESAWNILYKRGFQFKKTLAVIKGFIKRFFAVMQCGKYDYVFIPREASPLGPPIFEWMIARLFRKKIIFDFDDAIWIPTVSVNNQFAKRMKCFWKIKYICKWSYKVSAGNDYLADWARESSPNVVVNPTCVDMEKRYSPLKEQLNGRVAIGWTGSHSTLKYLNTIYPVIKRLEGEHDFDFYVICDKPPDFRLKSLRFIKWREATEIEDLMNINIGVMPLTADEWSKGKCGFKLIQYLALGIPAVASPVGVNEKIITSNQNGFFSVSEAEWYQCLKQLLVNDSLRREFGKKGKEKMQQEYSIASNSANFLSLFS